MLEGKPTRWQNRANASDQGPNGTTSVATGALGVAARYPCSPWECRRSGAGCHWVPPGATQGSKGSHGVTKGSRKRDTLKSCQLQRMGRKVSRGSRRGQTCHKVSQGVKTTPPPRGTFGGNGPASPVQAGSFRGVPYQPWHRGTLGGKAPEAEGAQGVPSPGQRANRVTVGTVRVTAGSSGSPVAVSGPSGERNPRRPCI
jgi:hypothetical protein